MKVVILAGGRKSSISNVGEEIPKPMVEIGGKPLLWHIMKHFSKYGLTEFVVCGGYRVDVIKDYFKDYYIYESDITVDLKQNTIEIHKRHTEDWRVTVVDTGLDASPCQRIAAVSDYISMQEDNQGFVVTYGDCLSDIDMSAMTQSHMVRNRLVTLTLAKPQGRKQLIATDNDGLFDYDNTERMENVQAWVNGDCYIMDRRVLGYLKENEDLESQVLRDLSRLGQVNTYKHSGYWNTIETRRDLSLAETMWESGNAVWM